MHNRRTLFKHENWFNNNLIKYEGGGVYFKIGLSTEFTCAGSGHSWSLHPPPFDVAMIKINSIDASIAFLLMRSTIVIASRLHGTLLPSDWSTAPNASSRYRRHCGSPACRPGLRCTAPGRAHSSVLPALDWTAP